MQRRHQLDDFIGIACGEMRAQRLEPVLADMPVLVAQQIEVGTSSLAGGDVLILRSWRANIPALRSGPLVV